MATRTVTNTDYISAITVPGDVKVDTIEAKTGTFSDSVTAPNGTFTQLRANTASIDVIQEHIVTNDSIIELDSGNTGDSRTSGITAKYVSGAETKYAGLLREAGGGFHLVDDNKLPDPDTNPATLAKADLAVKQLRTSGHILPSTGGLFDIGNVSNGFRELRLARGSGSIGLGWSMRVSSQAELHLNASGDNRSEITFGTGTSISPSNTKWAFNSFRNSEGNHFALLRGPYLMGSNNWQYVLHVDGATAQLRYNIETQSTSTTTGCARFAGGVGIAKNLHVGGTLGSESSPVGGIYLASPGGVPSLLNRYERFNVITTLTGPWTGEKLFLIKVTLIGAQIFINAEGGMYNTEQNASLISTAGSGIPERLRPSSGNEIVHVITVSNAGVETPGKVTITSAGMLTISPVGNGGWTHVPGGSVRWDAIHFTYTLS